MGEGLKRARAAARASRVKPKPVKWIRKSDPQCCCACEKPFIVGDKVYHVGAMSIHHDCVKLYVQQCKEIGITP